MMTRFHFFNRQICQCESLTNKDKDKDKDTQTVLVVEQKQLQEERKEERKEEEKEKKTEKGNKNKNKNKNINNDAFIDYLKKIPINPYIDRNENFGKYEYPIEKKPIERYTGVQIYEEENEKDEKKNKPIEYPFPINKEIVFKKNKINKSEDRININYSNIGTDIYPEEGYKQINKKKHFLSEWELLLAHNHNLYNFKNNKNYNSDFNISTNKDQYMGNTENDIRNKLNLFIDKINIDNKNDSCKYLAIEEYKCLLSNSFHMNINGSNQKCVKWFNEYVQCKWDEHKLNQGYNYIEDRRHKKSKSYIAAPDYQYS